MSRLQGMIQRERIATELVLNVLQIPPSELFALLAAVGFAAGLNLYATVAVLGLLARFGHLRLPPGLLLLAGWPVIAASTALFILEFFAARRFHSWRIFTLDEPSAASRKHIE